MGSEPERLSGAAVSTDFFELLGARFTLGRPFRAEEERPGNDLVAVLSHDLWYAVSMPMLRSSGARST